jgi:hypothetical protein
MGNAVVDLLNATHGLVIVGAAFVIIVALILIGSIKDTRKRKKDPANTAPRPETYKDNTEGWKAFIRGVKLKPKPKSDPHFGQPSGELLGSAELEESTVTVVPDDTDSIVAALRQERLHHNTPSVEELGWAQLHEQNRRNAEQYLRSIRGHRR